MPFFSPAQLMRTMLNPQMLQASLALFFFFIIFHRQGLLQMQQAMGGAGGMGALGGMGGMGALPGAPAPGAGAGAPTTAPGTTPPAATPGAPGFDANAMQQAMQASEVLPLGDSESHS